MRDAVFPPSVSYPRRPLFVEILDGRARLLSTGKGLSVDNIVYAPIQLFTIQI